MEIANRFYDEDDDTVLPRSIATREAFENAMTLDIAMGGSTNTVLHLLAAAQRGRGRLHDGATSTRVSRRVPCICKVAPNGSYLMEDVHRAGGIPAILGELRRGGLLQRGRRHRARAHDGRVARTRGTCAVRAPSEAAVELFHAAPGCVRSSRAFSQSERWETLDLDAADGCIRDVAHAYSADGGLAILYGNLAERGCVVKTAGVDESILRFSGPAVVVESQEEAVDADPRRTASSPATWS